MHWWAGYEGSGERAGKGQAVDSALFIIIKIPWKNLLLFTFKRKGDSTAKSIAKRLIAFMFIIMEQDTPSIAVRLRWGGMR